MILQPYLAYLLFEEEQPYAVPSAISPSIVGAKPKPFRIPVEAYYARLHRQHIREQQASILKRKLRKQQAEQYFETMVREGMEHRRKAAIWTVALAEL